MQHDLFIVQATYSPPPKKQITWVKLRSLSLLTGKLVEAVTTRHQIVIILQTGAVIKTFSTHPFIPDPEVLYYPLNGDWYIKTAPNDIEEDNLESLNNVTECPYIFSNNETAQLYQFLFQHW